MPTHLTKYFGEVELDDAEKYYEITLELHGKSVEVTIELQKGISPVSELELQTVDDYLNDLENHEQIIRGKLREDFRAEGEAKNYIDSQIEEQDPDEIAELIKPFSKRFSKAEKVLAALQLVELRFYPQKDDKMFAVYDYTIGQDLTDDLLVVKLSKDNSLEITIES